MTPPPLPGTYNGGSGSRTTGAESSELAFVAALAGVLAWAPYAEILRALGGDELVLAGAAADSVVALLRLDLVVAAVADDHVGMLRPLQLVGSVGADDRRAAPAAGVDVLPVGVSFFHRRGGVGQVHAGRTVRLGRPDVELARGDVTAIDRNQ